MRQAWLAGLIATRRITGNTSAASCRWPPRTLFQNILREAAKVLDAAGIATVVLIAPIAWYLTGKCCDNLDHIVNLGTDEFHGEMLRASNAAEEAVIVAQLDENFHVFHPMDIFIIPQGLLIHEKTRVQKSHATAPLKIL